MSGHAQVLGCARRGGFAVALACTLWVILNAAFLTGRPAFAAHNARIDVTPARVQPGGEVTVVGLWNFAPTPVDLHWDGLDGPILATVPSRGSFGPVTVRIPDVSPGVYVLLANQDVPESHAAAKAIPARARIEVVGPNGVVPPEPEPSPTSSVPVLSALQEQESPGIALHAGVALTSGLLTLAVAFVVARWMAPSGAGRPSGSARA